MTGPLGYLRDKRTGRVEPVIEGDPTLYTTCLDTAATYLSAAARFHNTTPEAMLEDLAASMGIAIRLGDGSDDR